jgi:hypothetical protein
MGWAWITTCGDSAWRCHHADRESREVPAPGRLSAPANALRAAVCATAFRWGKACPIAQANRYGHGIRDSWHEWHVVRQFQQLGNRQGKQRLGGERASVRRRAGPHAGGSRIAQVSDCHQRCAQRYFSVANPRYDRSSGCTPLWGGIFSVFQVARTGCFGSPDPT